MTTSAAVHPTSGRPSAARKYYEGKLYPLLRERLPHHQNATGRLDVGSLATAMGISGQTLYFSMSEDRLTPRIAKLVVDESRGKLSPQDLAAFVIV